MRYPQMVKLIPSLLGAILLAGCDQRPITPPRKYPSIDTSKNGWFGNQPEVKYGEVSSYSANFFENGIATVLVQKNPTRIMIKNPGAGRGGVRINLSAGTESVYMTDDQMHRPWIECNDLWDTISILRGLEEGETLEVDLHFESNSKSHLSIPLAGYVEAIEKSKLNDLTVRDSSPQGDKRDAFD